MKTTTRLIGLAVAVAMVLSIAFSGVALASQPVCPTPETETISTITMISCSGMVTEMEKLNWKSSNENLTNNPPLGINETVGQMDYYHDMKVTDGITNFIKNLEVDTGDAPNLNVMKSIGFAQGTTIGSLADVEEVSFGIVANWTHMEDVILCPFAAAAQTLLPASCEDVKASSKMVVTEVLETTVTRVDISESPLGLHYEVIATGLDGAGFPAHGSIVAEFDVYVEDGSGSGKIGGYVGHCDRGDPKAFSLGSVLTHHEKSTANGLWEFQKQMDYQSRIRP